MQIFPPYFVDILRYVIINIKISNGGLGMNGSGMSDELIMIRYVKICNVV